MREPGDNEMIREKEVQNYHSMKSCIVIILLNAAEICVPRVKKFLQILVVRRIIYTGT